MTGRYTRKNDWALQLKFGSFSAFEMEIPQRLFTPSAHKHHRFPPIRLFPVGRAERCDTRPAREGSFHRHVLVGTTTGKKRIRMYEPREIQIEKTCLHPVQACRKGPCLCGTPLLVLGRSEIERRNSRVDALAHFPESAPRSYGILRVEKKTFQRGNIPSSCACIVTVILSWWLAAALLLGSRNKA